MWLPSGRFLWESQHTKTQLVHGEAVQQSAWGCFRAIYRFLARPSLDLSPLFSDFLWLQYFSLEPSWLARKLFGSWLFPSCPGGAGNWMSLPQFPQSPNSDFHRWGEPMTHGELGQSDAHSTHQWQRIKAHLFFNGHFLSFHFNQFLTNRKAGCLYFFTRGVDNWKKFSVAWNFLVCSWT